MKKAIPMVRNVFEEQSPREIKSVDNVFGNFLASKGLYDEIEIVVIPLTQSNRRTNG